jgi:hypothetical protein
LVGHGRIANTRRPVLDVGFTPKSDRLLRRHASEVRCSKRFERKLKSTKRRMLHFGQPQLGRGHFLDWRRNSRNAYRTPAPILLVDRPCGSSPRQRNAIACITGTSTFCNGLRRTLKRGVVKLSRATLQQNPQP